MSTSVGAPNLAAIVCFFVFVAITLAIPLLEQTLKGDAQASARPRLAACAGWDDAASEAIVQLVKAKRDVDLAGLVGVGEVLG